MRIDSTVRVDSYRQMEKNHRKIYADVSICRYEQNHKQTHTYIHVHMVHVCMCVHRGDIKFEKYFTLLNVHLTSKKAPFALSI